MATVWFGWADHAGWLVASERSEFRVRLSTAYVGSSFVAIAFAGSSMWA